MYVCMFILSWKDDPYKSANSYPYLLSAVTTSLQVILVLRYHAQQTIRLSGDKIKKKRYE